MSRFYETLEAANTESRPDRAAEPFGESVDRTTFEDLAGALVGSILDQADPERCGHAESMASSPTKVSETTDNSSTASPEQAPEEALPAGCRNDSRGNTSGVSFERTARVLPHVVNRSVLERYRRLRTKIIQQQEANPLRTLLVTSASPNEGKTVTVVNLGLSFGMIPDFKVLLVDGDLRRGTLRKWLGVEGRPGLSNLVEGTAALDDVILRCDNLPIDVVVSGNSKLPPGELLQSKELRRHFASMAERYSLVLVDSPPVNLFTDTHLLAASCDAVMLVARAYSTTRKLVQKAAQDLASHRMIGVILNAGTSGNQERHSYED